MLEKLHQSQIWGTYEMSPFLLSNGLWNCCILQKLSKHITLALLFVVCNMLLKLQPA